MTKQQISQELEEAISSGVALLDFSASWCGPCRAQEPIIEQLTQSYDGQAVVKKVDIDEHRDFAVRMGIQSVPTLVLFKDGQEEQRFIGMQNKTVLQKALDAALN